MNENRTSDSEQEAIEERMYRRITSYLILSERGETMRRPGGANSDLERGNENDISIYL